METLFTVPSPTMPAPPAVWYLLAFVNGGQWGHLAVLVGAEDLTEGAGGHLTAQAVDIDLLLFVFLAHEVLLSLGVQWPGGERAGWQKGQGPGWREVGGGSHKYGAAQDPIL